VQDHLINSQTKPYPMKVVREIVLGRPKKEEDLKKEEFKKEENKREEINRKDLKREEDKQKISAQKQSEMRGKVYVDEEKVITERMECPSVIQESIVSQEKEIVQPIVFRDRERTEI